MKTLITPYSRYIISAAALLSISCTATILHANIIDCSGGACTGQTIGSGDTLEVNSGGESSSNIVNDQGALVVNSGGTSTTDTINKGGSMTVNDGGTATNATITGGSLVINTGATVTGATVDADSSGFFSTTPGSAVVNSGSTVSDLSVLGGSSLTVNGATISDLTVQGTAVIESGSVINGMSSESVSGPFNEKASEIEIKSGATVNNLSSDSAKININGGTVDGATMQDYGRVDPTVTVNNGGVLKNVTGISSTDIIINGAGSRAENLSGFDSYSSITTTGAASIDQITIGNAAINFTTEATITNATQGTDGNQKAVSIIDGKATGFNISESSSLTLTDNGSAQDIIVNGGSFSATGTNNSIDNIELHNGSTITLTTDNTITNSKQVITDADWNTTENVFDIADKTVNNLLINQGMTLEVKSDGTANNTTFQNGGKLVLNDGSTLTNTTVASGSLSIDKNISATNTTVQDGSKLQITNGSYNGLIIENGGTLTATGGSIDGLDLAQSSIYNLTTDAIISNSKVATAEGDKSFTIQNKIANGLYINNGSKLTVNENGSAQNIEVASGGKLALTGTTSANAVHFADGGQFELSTNNTLTNSTQGNNNQAVSIQNKLAQGLDIGSGSSLSIYADGAGQNLTVSGGTLALTGGKLINTQITGGHMNIDAATQFQNITMDGGTVSLEDTVAENLTLNSGSLNVNDAESTLRNSTINGGNLTVAGRIENSTINGGTALLRKQADGVTVNGGNVRVQGQMTNSVINAGGIITTYGLSVSNIDISNTVINEGGELVLNNRRVTATNTTVENGGKLTASNNALIKELNAKAGSILSIASNVRFTGDILIDKTAVLGGGYDFNSLFTNPERESLILTGGVNDTVVGALENTHENKKLVLADGDYLITSTNVADATQVSGWNTVEFQNLNQGQETIVKIAEALIAPEIVINYGAELNLSGNSPQDTLLDGSVVNNGTLSFVHPDDEPDDTAHITGNYTAMANAVLKLDVDPETNKSDILIVDGDVRGTTKLYLNVLSEEKPTENILFAQTHNDDLRTASNFTVWRVEGSPFMWQTIYDTASKDWYLNLDEGVAPEIMAYMGLGAAGFEQTRNMVDNVGNKVASNMMYYRHCARCYDTGFDAKDPRYNLWFAPVYSSANIKKPVDFEANISGAEAGFDFYADSNNRAGVFASYRQGDYDFSGKGSKYYSKGKSDIDIDSYMAGLYYRYDDVKNYWGMATVYAGLQKADLKSRDGVKANSDGTEIGAAIEAGYIYELAKDMWLEPTAALRYNQIDFDGFTDNAAKHVSFDTFRELEAELGVKLEKSWSLEYGIAKLYAKPAAVQRIVSGDDITITGFDTKISTLRNETLARLEFGGNMMVAERLNAFANTSYTFNKNYNNLTLNLGLNYAF